jgi:hypothetical protein
VDSFDSVRRAMRDNGVTEILLKRLAPNDNSKNQVYVGGDLSSIGKLPSGGLTLHEGTSTKRPAAKRGPIFRAPVDFHWLTSEGRTSVAPGAKLIVYPQYPEVRLSGFIAGCRPAPGELFDPTKRGRDYGRVLLLGITSDRRIVAAAFAADHPVAQELGTRKGEKYGVLETFPVDAAPKMDSERLLLRELARIHSLGWILSKRLTARGMMACNAPNCGGYTLEAELGVIANGFAEPDFHGWEIKQHGVRSFHGTSSGRVTLLTPEPNGGVYAREGPESFVRKWGYEDRRGRADRLNIGGVYRCGKRPNILTGLRLVLCGFDAESGKIDGGGSVALLDDKDTVAAEWTFAKLMDHWKRKHDKAAYVPSMRDAAESLQYRYGKDVLLAEGAAFIRLLYAFHSGVVFYDPGIKLEGAAGPEPAVKRRSQFRVSSRHLPGIYNSSRSVDVLAGHR